MLPNQEAWLSLAEGTRLRIGQGHLLSPRGFESLRLRDTAWVLPCISTKRVLCRAEKMPQAIFGSLPSVGITSGRGTLEGPGRSPGLHLSQGSPYHATSAHIVWPSA